MLCASSRVRVETIVPVLDDELKRELDQILDVYETDNASAWDCGPDGVYSLRAAPDAEQRRVAQEVFIRLAAGEVLPKPLDAVG